MVLIIDWLAEVHRLAKFARTELQAVLAAFTHGLISKWAYAVLVFSVSSGGTLDELKQAILQDFIPGLSNKPAPSANIRQLLILPARLGGMGLISPSKARQKQRETLIAVAKLLVALIHQQKGSTLQTQLEQVKLKRELKKVHDQLMKREAEAVIDSLPPMTARCARAA